MENSEVLLYFSYNSRLGHLVCEEQGYFHHFLHILGLNVHCAVVVVDGFELAKVLVDGKEIVLGVVIEFIDRGLVRIGQWLILHDIKETAEYFRSGPELSIILERYNHF